MLKKKKKENKEINLIGKTVVRGPTWEWYDQDYYNGKPGKGVIISGSKSRWYFVKWQNGDSEHCYRMNEIYHDLKVLSLIEDYEV